MNVLLILLSSSAYAGEQLDSDRHMPFLPGVNPVVTQANDGGTSHGGSIPESVDFAFSGNPRGIPVVAVADGWVNTVISGVADKTVNSGNYNNTCGSYYGNQVIYCDNFRQPPHQCEMAGHLREVFVQEGEYVKQGQVIGLLGHTGSSTNPHLHSHLQENYAIRASIASSYKYLTSVNGNPDSPLTAVWTAPCTGCYWSANEGIMGELVDAINLNNSLDLGDEVSSITRAAVTQGGVAGYGWYKTFVNCDDNDGDSNVTCSNDLAYRENAYIRRYSYTSGNWYGAVIVYDALSGATTPYVVRSGFLTNSSSGWDILGGPNSVLGMPIENERVTATGSEQYFQRGILRWTSSTGLVTLHNYSQTTGHYFGSVGPGVFAPNDSRFVYHWNRLVSYRIVDAWNRNGGAVTLGQPASDNGADAGVHTWGAKRFLIQNFAGGTYGDAAIVYDPWSKKYAGLDMFDVGSTTPPAEGWNRAYVIRTAFWEWYRYEGGIDRMKAPIADEVVTGTGAKQEFLCGWLEYTTSTGAVSPHEESWRAGCNLTAPIEPSPTDVCYDSTSSDSQALFSSDGMGGPVTNTIFCSVGPTDTLIEITGPIQDGLFAPVTGATVYLEYGSNTDGWDPYTSGKPKKTWTTDTVTNGDPVTYSMYVGANVDEMNFFLYEPATGDQEWFDLSQWTASGDCYHDGGLIYRLDLSYPPAEGEITCTLTEDDLIVDITGPVQALLVEPYVANPDEIQYGSNTDGWTVPYSSGKPAEPWTGAWTHTIVLDPDTYNFNFYLSDVDGVGGEWFDLVDGDYDGDAWTVNGDCWEDGGTITHDPPPVTPVGTITCDEVGADLHVTISGDIPAGIFGVAPTGSGKYLEYGSNAPTPAWTGYTSGKPKKTWVPTTTSYTLILGGNVNEMNWFLYKSTTGQINWFDLSKWTVTGDCWEDGGLIRH